MYHLLGKKECTTSATGKRREVIQHEIEYYLFLYIRKIFWWKIIENFKKLHKVPKNQSTLLLYEAYTIFKKYFINKIVFHFFFIRLIRIYPNLFLKKYVALLVI